MTKKPTKHSQKPSANTTVRAARSKSPTPKKKSSSVQARRTRSVRKSETSPPVQAPAALPSIASSKPEYSGPQIVPIGIAEVNEYDLRYMLAIQDKNIEAPNILLEKIAKNEYTLWRIIGDARGIVITFQEDDCLLVYFLQGDGIYAKQVSNMKEILMRLARSLGLRGLRCYAESIETVRLWLSGGGRIVRAEMEYTGESS